MKGYIYLLITLLMCSVYATSAQDNKAATDSTLAQEPEPYMLSYVVVMQEGYSYAALDIEMYRAAEKYKISIDTMDRHYDARRKMVVLPDNAADDIYAGDYYPRRYASNTLSIEHLDYYTNSALGKKLALVAGIFSNKKEAYNLINKIKSGYPKAYILKANIYIGCMH